MNSPIENLRHLKTSGIEFFKMQYHYGFIRRLLDTTHTFFHDPVRSIKGNKKSDHIDHQLADNSNEKLKQAIEFKKTDTLPLETPPNIIFISNFLPRFDKTASDFRLLKILNILLQNECQIEYVYSIQTANDDRYMGALKGSISFKHLKLNQHDYQRLITGSQHNYVWITSLWRIEFIEFMAKLVQRLQTELTAKKIIIDTVDFHAKEFYRKYELNKNPKDLATANAFLKYESILYRAADNVIVVSKTEKNDIQEKISAIKNFAVVPIVYDISTLSPPHHKRKHICFVGNFGNQHNVDAVKHFIENIFEWILIRNPRVEFHIIGHDSEKYRRTFTSHNVRVIGSVINLQKVLTYYRLFVCPMTYGAGMKGKIADAIVAGIPVVTTPIGAEGFPVQDGVECLISNSPREFAEKCNQCLEDPHVWYSLSVKSRIMLMEHFSPVAIQREFRRIFMS